MDSAYLPKYYGPLIATCFADIPFYQADGGVIDATAYKMAFGRPKQTDRPGTIEPGSRSEPAAEGFQGKFARKFRVVYVNK
jgi:hypothetical protein